MTKTIDEYFHEALEEIYGQNDLEHSGVPGMKWGKRNGPPYPLDRQKRFGGTEKNGTGSASTSAKERLGSKASKAKSVLKQIKAKRDAKKHKKDADKIINAPASKAIKPKKITELSNEELKQRIDRLKLEQEYYNILGTINKNRPRPFGEKIVNGIINNAVSEGTMQFGKKIGGTAGGKLAESLINSVFEDDKKDRK